MDNKKTNKKSNKIKDRTKKQQEKVNRLENTIRDMKDKDKGLFTEKVNTGERKSLKYVKQAIAEKDEEKRNKIINEKFKLKDTVESIKSSKLPEKVKNIMIDSIKSGNKLDKSDYEKIYEKVNKKKELPKIKNSITKGNKMSESEIETNQQMSATNSVSVEEDRDYISDTRAKIINKEQLVDQFKKDQKNINNINITKNNNIIIKDEVNKIKKQHASLTDLRKQMGLVKGEQTKKILDSRKEKDNNKNAEGFIKS